MAFKGVGVDIFAEILLILISVMKGVAFNLRYSFYIGGENKINFSQINLPI